MAPTPWAVIAGVGAVALLARTPDSYKDLADEINKSGGKAIGISTDVSDASSVKAAFSKIEKEFGSECAAAIFNASGKLTRKSVLELTEEEFTAGYTVSCKGAFLFTQSAMPYLLKVAESGGSKHPPTLIFTGATASVKSSALFSSFSTGKYAQRAFALSTAREFGPKGVHVAHAIIDGVINVPHTQGYLKDTATEGAISPEGIADAYLNLHTQPKTAFSNEIDIRPMLEKW
ncbi:hypothetical protein ANO11243_066290 [Dothideomycetidae sp. 11243]|nr:hypothetical protein ANO11243_066290 [fungal sp. No.11243]